LDSSSGTILLDFGRRMGITGDFYSEFLQIRAKNALRDLLRLGVLPKIDGIYDKKHLDTTSLFADPDDIAKIPLDQASDYWITEDIKPCEPTSPKVDAVFISHAHFDHIQDVSFLDPCIPIISSPETEVLSKSIGELSMSGVSLQFYKLRRSETIVSKPVNYKTLFPGELDYKTEPGDKPDIVDPKTGFKFSHDYTTEIRSYLTESEGKIKGLKYKLIPVSHSLPGACSVLITTPDEKRILYSGDLRFHGATGMDKQQYADAIGGPVDCLIIEGTRIESEKVLTEHEIQDEIEADIAKTEGLVLIDFSWKDLSRFQVIYDAAKNNDRTFVISPKVAYLFYEMHCNFPEQYHDPRTMPNLRVYLKRGDTLLYSKTDYTKFKMGYLSNVGRNRSKKDRNIVRIAERLWKGGDPGNPNNPLPGATPGEPYKYQEVYDLATHHVEHGIKAYEIRKNPDKYVLMFSYWDANELFDLIPEKQPHRTKYIRASTEPFNDEMKIDQQKFVNWLDHFNVEYEHDIDDKGNKVFQTRHVSGHLSKPEIVELVRLLDPKTIIPVHTMRPEIFADLFGDRVRQVNLEEPHEVK
jgi:ribonuclease J